MTNGAEGGARRAVIFLTGFSGTGKSHVGRLVARRLGWEYVDSDEEITRRAGMPIVEIFEVGEAYFRTLERQVLKDLAREARRVVSTGGGAPVDPGNRALMARAGVCIRLKASAETIYERLNRSRRNARSLARKRGVIRPLLQREDPLARIRDLLARREQAYATADATVDTDGASPEEVADRVVEAWRSLAGGEEEIR